MSAQVKAALYSTLTGDSTLGALLSSGTAVYDALAPVEAVFPYVIFQKAAGTPAYTFAARAFEVEVFTIKGVTKGPSAVRAGQIADRIDTLLTDAALSITNGTLMYCRREADLDYPESSLGDVFRHCGGSYRLYVE